MAFFTSDAFSLILIMYVFSRCALSFEYAYSSDKPVLRKVSIVLAVYPLLATLLYGTSLSLTGPHHCPILRAAIK